MAQPINKWIEELEKEIVDLIDQIRERSMELQQKDPVARELFKLHAEKQGALDYLQRKSNAVIEEKPKTEQKQKRKKKDD